MFSTSKIWGRALLGVIAAALILGLASLNRYSYTNDTTGTLKHDKWTGKTYRLFNGGTQWFEVRG
jgi:hypothetical protein